MEQGIIDFEQIEEKKEPEQVQDQEQNELKEEKQEKEVENTDITSLEDFLVKNESLIKVINVTLESKGYSKSDIQTKMDEFFQAITETKLGQSHIESISNLLIELLSTTVETDKKDLVQFFKELFTVFEYDKEKIYEQIIQFSEDIEEQEKLKTRKLNRNIRSYIKDCQDNLNQIFKQDDMPPDRIVTFERFNQIAEEVGLNLKKEYLDSSVFVLPSYREGTPKTNLEAMSCGRPVITTDAPGCKETVIDGENGFLVPVRDIDAIYQKMKWFIENPAAAGTMGALGRKMVEEIFDVKKVNAVICEAMSI